MLSVVNRWVITAVIMFSMWSPLALAHSAFEEGSVTLDEPKAHVHGRAEMQVNIQRSTLVIDLKIPAIDVLGFEREPVTAEEHQLVKTTTHYLKQVNQWIEIVEAAGCVVESNKARSPYDSEKDHAHDHHTHSNTHHHSHSDFLVSAKWNCSKPAALTNIQVDLFSQLPRVQTINVSWIANETAGIATLTSTAKQVLLVAS